MSLPIRELRTVRFNIIKQPYTCHISISLASTFLLSFNYQLCRNSGPSSSKSLLFHSLTTESTNWAPASMSTQVTIHKLHVSLNFMSHASSILNPHRGVQSTSTSLPPNFVPRISTLISPSTSFYTPLLHSPILPPTTPYVPYVLHFLSPPP